jgi:hypothetical protein
MSEYEYDLDGESEEEYLELDDQEDIDSMIKTGELEIYEQDNRWCALVGGELLARSRTYEGVCLQLLGQPDKDWDGPHPLFEGE